MTLKRIPQLLCVASFLGAIGCGAAEPQPTIRIDDVTVGLTADGTLDVSVHGEVPRQFFATDPDVDPMAPAAGVVGATDPDVDPMSPVADEVGATDPDVDPMSPPSVDPIDPMSATDPDVDPMDGDPVYFTAKCADTRGPGASDFGFDVVVSVPVNTYGMSIRGAQILCAIVPTLSTPTVRIRHLRPQ